MTTFKVLRKAKIKVLRKVLKAAGYPTNHVVWGLFSSAQQKSTVVQATELIGKDSKAVMWGIDKNQQQIAILKEQAVIVEWLDDIHKQFVFHLQPELHRRLKLWAIDNELTLSAAVEKFIVSGLKKSE